MPDFNNWPINIRKLFFHESNEQNKDEQALVGENHVIGWLYLMTKAFHQKFGCYAPASAIQLKTDDTQPYRIDLDLIYEKASKVCHPIREKENNEVTTCTCCCYGIDNAVSMLYLGKTKTELNISKEVLNKSFSIYTSECCNQSINQADCFVEFNKSKNYSLIYHCPRTWMIEVAIPIFVDHKVVAVLITGQFVLKNEKKQVEENCRYLFSRLNLDASMINFPKEELKTRTNVREYQNFFVNQVQEKQDSLNNRIRNYRESQIFNVFKAFNEATHEKYHNNIISSGLEGVTEHFQEGSLALYSLDKRPDSEHSWFLNLRFPNIEDNNLPDQLAIPKSREFIEKHSNNQPNTIDYSEIDELDTIIVSESESKYPTALKSKKLAKFHKYVFFIQSKEAIPFYTILYYSLKPLSKVNIELARHLVRQIGLELNTRRMLQEVRATKNEFDLTLRSVGHELSQQIASAYFTLGNIQTVFRDLNEMIHTYIPDEIAKKYKQKEHSLVEYYQDIEAFLNNVEMQAESAKRRVFMDKPNKRTFWMFAESLFRLRSCFRVELKARDMNIFGQFSTKLSPLDPSRPPVYGDKDYLELAAYNLIKNASKYGYGGTNIYFDCVKNPDDDNAPHHLTVRNFGPGIPDDQQTRIFELGYRYNRNVEGEGFGLFFVSEIAKIHNGKAYCTCSSKPISKFNIPYIQSGIKLLQGKPEHEDILQELITENKRLVVYDFYGYAVHRHQSFDSKTQSPKAMLRLLTQATYDVLFTIEIPSQHNQDSEDK